MNIQVFENYIIKRENPAFPEVEKYKILNASNAPVVKLLDVLEKEDERLLILQKAAPLNLNTTQPQDFASILHFLTDLAGCATDAYPPTNWDYIHEFWANTTRLIEWAMHKESPLYMPSLVEVPSPGEIIMRFEQLESQPQHCISHGDPADFNLGVVDGAIVAFDLGLSWRGLPFRDVALRSGASVSVYPQQLDIPALVQQFADNAHYTGDDALAHYALTGVVFGAYFEKHALDDVFRDGSASQSYAWAKLTLERYERFARAYIQGGAVGRPALT